MDACCTIISIHINKYSNVNCTLNRVYKITDVSSFTRYKVKYLAFRALPVIMSNKGQSSKRRVFLIATFCSKYNLHYCICQARCMLLVTSLVSSPGRIF